jgi:hypothetical protein
LKGFKKSLLEPRPMAPRVIFFELPDEDFNNAFTR